MDMIIVIMAVEVDYAVQSVQKKTSRTHGSQRAHPASCIALTRAQGPLFPPYTVPNAQKIILPRTQSRASRRQPDFPGSDFLPCPEPGLGREVRIIYFTLFRGSFEAL